MNCPNEAEILTDWIWTEGDNRWRQFISSFFTGLENFSKPARRMAFKHNYDDGIEDANFKIKSYGKAWHNKKHG